MGGAFSARAAKPSKSIYLPPIRTHSLFLRKRQKTALQYEYMGIATCYTPFLRSLYTHLGNEEIQAIQY